MGHRHKHNNHNFAKGLILGSLAGGLTALLFAPKKGKHLRKDLAHKYEELSDKTHDVIDEATHRAEKLVSKAKKATRKRR